MALNQVFSQRVFVKAGNQTSINVLHYLQFTQVGMEVPTSAIHNAWETNLPGLYKACLSNQAEYRGQVWQRVRPAPPTAPVISIVSAGVGTQVADVLPRNVSSILTLRSALAGRRYRGRVFVPFPSEAANTAAGAVAAAHQASLQALADELLLGFTVTVGANVAQFKLVIYHRNDTTTTDVTSAEARPYWAQQHRRGDYGQSNFSI